MEVIPQLELLIWIAIFKKNLDPLSNQDVATKNYVDTNAFTTAGVVLSGDIKLSVRSDLVRSL